MSQQINLFNPIFKKQKKYLSAVTMAQGLAMILAGLMLFSFYADYQVSSISVQAATTAQQLQGAISQLSKVTTEFTPRQRSKALEEEIQRVEGELNSQREVFDVVRKGGLGNTKGYSEFFQAFSRQITNGIWLTGLQIQGAGTEIELRGRAMQPELLPAYINRLKGEASMQGKSFANLEMQVPSVEAQTTDARGAPVTTRTPAGYIEFVLQTSVTVKESDSNPLDMPRSLGAPNEPPNLFGAKPK